MTAPPSRTLLAIAGLDPGGGAGLLADARVAAEHGLRAAGVVTVLTEQDSRGLRASTPVDSELVGAQLRTLLSDIEVAAVKIGALGDDAIAREVAAALELTAAPVVWDPVLRATSGSPPLFAGNPEATFAALLPHLSLITPNVDEAELIAGKHIGDGDTLEAAARSLAARGTAALITGGHLGGAVAADLLARGGGLVRFAEERIPGGADVHGSGCALSSSIASRLALGEALEDAVRAAKRSVTERLRDPAKPGRGAASIV